MQERAAKLIFMADIKNTISQYLHYLFLKEFIKTPAAFRHSVKNSQFLEKLKGLFILFSNEMSQLTFSIPYLKFELLQNKGLPYRQIEST